MVKGINKQVLEIHDTGCDCFEKALFFISPKYMDESDSKLRKNALRTIQNSSSFPMTKKQKRKSHLVFLCEMVASASAGAFLSALILWLL